MKKIKIILALLFVPCCFAVGFYLGDKSTKNEVDLTSKISQLEEEKQQFKKNAEQFEKQAKQAIQNAEIANKTTQEAKSELKKERETVHIEYIDGIEYLPASVSESQDKVIASLEVELDETKKALNLTNCTLTETKKQLERSELQRNLEHIAYEANKSAIKSARWTGRFEGAGVMEGINLLAKLIK